MGLFYLVSRLTVTSLGTLYPIYLSYKAIKANDLASLETLLMYWVVMGAVGAAEGTIEWVVNWIPFYYEVKTVVILWLTLPQIQGSTYVYLTYIHPFLLDHEHDIDAALVEAKAKAKQAGLDYLRRAGDKIRELLLGSLSPSVQAAAGDATQAGYPFPASTSAQQYYQQFSSSHPPQRGQQPAQPPPQPPSFATQLLRQYGPAAYAAGAAFLHPMANRPPAPNTSIPAPSPQAATIPSASGTALEEHEGSLRQRHYSTRSVSSGSISSTAAEAPTRTRTPTQVQVEEFIQREKARRAAAVAAGGSSDAALTPPPASGGGWPLFGRRTSTPLPKPASGSDAPTQRRAVSGGEPVAGERSLYGGFEEIERDEAQAPEAVAAPSPNKEGGGWWFGWGGKPVEEAARAKAE